MFERRLRNVSELLPQMKEDSPTDTSVDCVELKL